MRAIRVTVMKRAGRRFWEAQWVDPETGRKRTESTGKERKRDAERIAGKIEATLNAGAYHRQRNITWTDAADKYERDFLTGLATKTAYKWTSTRAHVERHINPVRLSAVNAPAISDLQGKLRGTGLKEATIKSILSTLRAFLNWCRKLSLLKETPHIEMPIRTDKARGRAPTQDEFERILKAIPGVVGEEFAAEWRRSLTGLWGSGLRLGEALQATWHSGPFAVCMTGPKPRLLIQSLVDKSGKPRTLPLADDFWRWLWETPESERQGFLFRFPLSFNPDLRRTDSVGKVITAIGESAKVNVSMDSGTKWASAHDFRRAFGTRWAQRLFPKQLQELMRHRSISTTMTFYTHLGADDVEAAIEAVQRETANALANTNSASDSVR